MLRFCVEEGVLTRGDAQRYIGQRFKIKSEMPPWSSDEAICQQLMKRVNCIDAPIIIINYRVYYREHICAHLNKNIDKFNMLM